MDLQAHKKTLGIVHLVYGIIVFLLFAFVGVLASTFAPFIAEAIAEEDGKQGAVVFEMIANVVRLVLTLALIFSALPSIIAGIGLLQRKNWGIIMALIAGCICILSFPFGTALGAYSIFVFIENNKAKNDKDQG
ncbi:MAG: hypothetical protein Tsb0034_12960 [Ekhidna sp.]